MAEAVQRGWLAQPGGLLYLTAGLDVTYLRPTPLHETSESATALWRRWWPRWLFRPGRLVTAWRVDL
jgi:hypothetical protein